MSVNNDPILSIRLAICEGMRSVMRNPDKEFVDAIIDALPEFFRQPLTGCKWPGDLAYKNPVPCGNDTWRVFHGEVPGKKIAEFYGDKAEEAAKEFCRLAAK